MGKIRIRTNNQEVKYKGILFPFGALKKKVIELTHPGYLLPYVIKKTFNKVSGDIEFKYAWESIFLDMRDHGLLEHILKILIEESKKEE